MLDAYGDGEPAADLIGGWLHDHTDLPREGYPFRDDDPEAFDRELREDLAFREAGQDRLDFVLLPVREDGALPGADVDAPGAVNTSVGLALGFGALVRARMQAVACFGSDHIAPVLNQWATARLWLWCVPIRKRIDSSTWMHRLAEASST